VEPLPPGGGPVRAWVRFWFTPAYPVSLHAVRLLAGLLFLAWLLPFAGHLDSLFGRQGWFDQEAYAEASRLPDGSPTRPITWSVLYLVDADPTLLTLTYWASVVVVLLFTLGIGTRLTAVLTWVVVASFTANPALGYDADALLLILALYLMIGYVFLGQWNGELSPAERLLGPGDAFLLGRLSGSSPRPSVAANVALRLLQIHFAVVIITSGLHKLQFGDWWAGVTFWYPLYPPFEATVAQARTYAANAEFYMSILNLGAYATLAWQIGFPLFAWRTGWWRLILVGGAVIGWLGTALLWRLPLVGPAFLVGCLSFLTAAEWRRVLAWLPIARDEAKPSASRKDVAASLVAGGRR
jgi:hypothetical protein